MLKIELLNHGKNVYYFRKTDRTISIELAVKRIGRILESI